MVTRSFVWSLVLIAVVIVAVVAPVITHANPDETSDDTARIRQHLTGALSQLRAKDVTALAATPRQHRRAALDALERYVQRGVFPRRTDDSYTGLRPRFVDDRGVHCAVAQLIADSGAVALVRTIAATHEYAYVGEIHAPALEAWATDHGFTLDELAQIQPRYTPPAPMRPIRLAIERAKHMIGHYCASRFPSLERFSIRVFVSEYGDARVATYAPAFAQCFANEASRLAQTSSSSSPSGRRRYAREDYYFEMDIVLTPLRAGRDRPGGNAL
jgi:hypothetical protein